MDQATNRLTQRPARPDKALVSWRNLGALALFLYGTSFLWLTAAFAGTGTPASGTAWTVTQLLVIATIGGFSVAAWGIYKATSWWERLAVGSAIFGFVPLIPYWLAASRVVGGGTVAQGVVSHVVGNALVLLLLLMPSPRHWIQDQVRGR
jgi:hypothetical protein